MKAINIISKKLNVNVRRFSFAGQKDKDAVTTQYVSVSNVPMSALRRLKIKDLEIEPIGYADKKISLGDQEGNKFSLIVRRLKNPLRHREFSTNYYGMQRFGGDVRPINHMVGRALVKKKYEKAMKIYLTEPFPRESRDNRLYRENLRKHWGRWDQIEVPESLLYEKQVIDELKSGKSFAEAFLILPPQLLKLFIQSYQSLIFNRTLYEYIKKNCPKYFEIEYGLGKYAFAKEIVDKEILIPVLGYDLKFKDPVIAEIALKLMKKEHITLEDFKNEDYSEFSSKSRYRDVFVKLKGLRIGHQNIDKMNKGFFYQKVQFMLPKGAFASVAVLALLK